MDQRRDNRTDIARTINVQSNPETERKTAHRLLRHSKLTEHVAMQALLQRVLETARGKVYSIRRSLRLNCQQKSPVTKEKVDVVLERLRRLDLGESDGDAVDEQESTRRGVLLRSVFLILLARPFPEPFLVTSIGSGASSGRFRTASRPRATQQTKKIPRPSLNSWTIFETSSQIIRSAVTPTYFYDRVYKNQPRRRTNRPYTIRTSG